MSMSLGEIATTPTTAPASRILTDAAAHANLGPFDALRIANLGTLDPGALVAVIAPEQVIAEGAALIVLAGLANPDIDAPWWPNADWSAGEVANAVGNAHRIVGAWAVGHTAGQLQHLFEAAADRARTEEGTDGV